MLSAWHDTHTHLHLSISDGLKGLSASSPSFPDLSDGVSRSSSHFHQCTVRPCPGKKAEISSLGLVFASITYAPKAGWASPGIAPAPLSAAFGGWEQGGAEENVTLQWFCATIRVSDHEPDPKRAAHSPGAPTASESCRASCQPSRVRPPVLGRQNPQHLTHTEGITIFLKCSLLTKTC